MISAHELFMSEYYTLTLNTYVTCFAINDKIAWATFLVICTYSDYFTYFSLGTSVNAILLTVLGCSDTHKCSMDNNDDD